MTLSTTTSRVEYAGNGTTKAFSFPYYFLAQGDLKVYVDGTLKALTTHYTVSGAGNPAGGTVAFITAPASDAVVAIFRDPALTQSVDYVANDVFPAASHETALDRLTMIAQRTRDLVSRALVLGDGAASTDTTLPDPEAQALIGWNSAGTALANYDLGDLATLLTYGDWRVETFTGDGSTTDFALADTPASVANTDVSIDGVTQVPDTDYDLLVDGVTLRFGTAPGNGTTICVRYGQAATQGRDDAATVFYEPAGTGAVLRSVTLKLREVVSVQDFGADPTGVADSGAAINLATAHIRAALLAGSSVCLVFPPGTYLTTISLNFTALRGASGDATWMIMGYGAKVYASCAGKAALDLMQSQFGGIQGLQIYGDPNNKPRCAVQLARGFLKSDGRPQTASHITLRDVKATGQYTWAAFYNYASEVNVQTNCTWENEDSTALADETTIVDGSEVFDVPYAAIFDSGNAWGCTSDYYTQTIPSPTATSMLAHNFNGVSFYRSNGGCCIWMDTGLANVNMTNCYAACLNGDAVVVYLARFTSAGNEDKFRKPYNWALDLHMESDADETNSFKNAFRVIPPDNNGGVAIAMYWNGFRFLDHNNHCDEALFRASTLLPAGSVMYLLDADIAVRKFRGTSYSITYEGDGAETVFDVPFVFPADADLYVAVDGVEQTLTTDYTVAGEGTSSATVTFLAAPAIGAVIEISRVGSVDDTDAGPPSEGIFAPADTWVAAGRMSIPSASSSMPIGLLRFSGDYLPRSLTGEFTPYPKGSYRIPSHETNRMKVKGDWEWYGDDTVEYQGDTLQSAAAFKILGGRIENEDGTLRLPILAADPTAANGAIYYNNVSKKVRVCEDSVWRDA